jgi:hypothetical protein
MRISILSVLACHVCNSLAAPIPSITKEIVARDYAVVEKELTYATAATKQFTRAINSLRPSVEDNRAQAQEIDRTGHNLVEVKRRAAEEIRKTTKLTWSDARGIQDPIALLQTATQSCMSALTTSAPTIRNLGGRESILGILEDLDEISNEFSDAIVQKIPDSVKDRGKSSGQKTKAMIAPVIQVYRVE